MAVNVNGIPLGDRIDHYHPDQVVDSGAIQLVTVPDSIKSPATLRVEVVGTNDKSTGIRYGWGLDCIAFRAK